MQGERERLLDSLEGLERVTGLEPAVFSLGS